MGIKLIKKLLAFLRPGPRSAYERVGGQVGISTLVDEFYRIMQTDPAARECLATHAGRDIQESAAKLKLFLSGWLGGPQLYLEKHGHPRLRMRHFPFAIGEVEAAQWLYCMERALQNSAIERSTQEELLRAFKGLTELIKNR